METAREFRQFADRIGEEQLSKRLMLQASHWARLKGQGKGVFKLERFISIADLTRYGLKACLLWKRAHHNVFDIEVTEQHWRLNNLPKNFDGFKLLQISDLHIDIADGLNVRIADVIRKTPHDAIVMTGDYRDSTDSNYKPSVELMKRVIDASDAPKYGILGNHDFIEMVWDLEAQGLPILLNEAISIKRSEQKLWICGVDDPHFYKTHDFQAARAQIPKGACKILLCHSPEVHEKATFYGFDLMLSGHTHGGQICLPGGRHVILPSKGLEKRFVKGAWKSGQMLGYTSRGTGSCGVAARLNCRPEMTVHHLNCVKNPDEEFAE